MYVPSHFLPKDSNSFQFIQQNSFGELSSLVEGKIFSSHLPFLYQEKNNSLLCHVAKANPQWQHISEQEVLAVFHGPHGYISPSWYQNAGVPTWNYQAVHVYGQAETFHDEVRLSDLVAKLSAVYEADFDKPWQPEYDQRMLKAIVGIEIAITDVQAKHKLSQNRTAAEQETVIRQLHSLGNAPLAHAMTEVLKPQN